VALPTLPDLQRSSPRGGHHAETHIAAALDPPAGCSPPRRSPPPCRLRRASCLGEHLGSVDRVGVEGTGSDGAGLGRWRRAHGQAVVEVDRPDRAARRRQGKADDLDATRPPEPALAGAATTTPRPPTARWR